MPVLQFSGTFMMLIIVSTNVISVQKLLTNIILAPLEGTHIIWYL